MSAYADRAARRKAALTGPQRGALLTHVVSNRHVVINVVDLVAL
ncbi:hypothetical protein ACWFRQ_12635 [Streptomyces niveus]